MVNYKKLKAESEKTENKKEEVINTINGLSKCKFTDKQK